MDPFSLPCHPLMRVSPEDRDWRAIGVRTDDDVTRKATRCPECKTSWTAFLRGFGPGLTAVEWVRPSPFRVSASATGEAPSVPLWQDAAPADPVSAADPQEPGEALARLQERTAGLGASWARSAQLVAPVHALTAQGQVFAVPGDLLLERREKWNAQDRRLALLWSPRLDRPVVAWHGFARLLQDA